MKETNIAAFAETYSLAYLARSNLVREAAREDHNLRVLMGHAAVLDSTIHHLNTLEQMSTPYSRLTHDVSNLSLSEKRPEYDLSMNISTKDAKKYHGSLESDSGEDREREQEPTFVEIFELDNNF